MKVKDFIKMLQEQDPEDYVRIPGGAILFAEPKEGYWDGAYEYRDGEYFVISTKGSKVDIHVQDVEDFIWDNDGDYSKIRLDFPNNGKILEQKIQEYQESFEKISKKYKQVEQQSQEHYTFQVLKRLQDSWRIRESKEHGKWSKSMMDFVKYDSKDERMCMGDCLAVHKSGLFESYDENNKFRFWRLKT